MSKTFRFAVILPTVAMLVASVVLLQPQTVSAQQATTTPLYESTPCKFDGADRLKVDCGMLTVPEDRSKPDGPTLRLAVAGFHALGRNPKPDPIVYLDCGPGIHTLDAAGYSFPDAVSGLGRIRNLMTLQHSG